MLVFENGSPKKLPEVLYHYTTQSGLLSILENDCIRATKIQYLNDSSEYQLALELSDKVLKERLKSEHDEKQLEKIKCLINNVYTIGQLNICVFSLSEERDLLSQWRAYGGDAAGYSIGFRASYIAAKAKEQNFVLAKCVYNEDEQKILITRLIDETLKQDFNTIPGYCDPKRPRTLVILHTGGDFTDQLAMIAPVIKHKTFNEEKEWRLISVKAINVRNMCFRPGLSMLTPYYNFALGANKDQYLDRVIIGPGPHMNLAEIATQSLLAYWDVAHVEVYRTEIPYRNW